ncbi:MAG TPA: hypothetical protein VFZ93_03685 [Albitalea sp.]
MKHAPATTKPRAVRRTSRDEVQVASPFPLASFFSFRYAATEVWAEGDLARVKTRTARLEDGRLSTEQFEGELPRADVERALQQAQQQVLEQAALWMRSLTSWWFLPWDAAARAPRADRED